MSKSICLSVGFSTVDFHARREHMSMTTRYYKGGLYIHLLPTCRSFPQPEKRNVQPWVVVPRSHWKICNIQHTFWNNIWLWNCFKFQIETHECMRSSWCNINSKYAYPQGMWCLGIHQIPNPPNSNQTQIASRAVKKTKKKKNKTPFTSRLPASWNMDPMFIEHCRCQVHVGHHADYSCRRTRPSTVGFVLGAPVPPAESVPAATGPQRSNCMHRTLHAPKSVLSLQHTNTQVKHTQTNCSHQGNQSKMDRVSKSWY
jgi:hypothetical protein